MHWRAMMESARERRCRHRRWLMTGLALAMLAGGLGWLGGCEFLHDSLPRIGREK